MTSTPAWYVYLLGGVGVALSGLFAFFGSVFGNRLDRRLSFEQRFWDERKQLYVAVSNSLSNITRSLAAAELDPWRGTRAYGFFADKVRRLQKSHGLSVAEEVMELGELSGQMRLLASKRVNDCYSAVLAEWNGLLGDITRVADGDPIDRPEVYKRWSEVHSQMLVVMISEMTSDLRSRKISGATKRKARKTFRQLRRRN